MQGRVDSHIFVVSDGDLFFDVEDAVVATERGSLEGAVSLVKYLASIGILEDEYTATDHEEICQLIADKTKEVVVYVEIDPTTLEEVLEEEVFTPTLVWGGGKLPEHTDKWVETNNDDEYYKGLLVSFLLVLGVAFLFFLAQALL